MDGASFYPHHRIRFAKQSVDGPTQVGTHWCFLRTSGLRVIKCCFFITYVIVYFCREFCSSLWLQLLVKLIKAGGDPAREETSFPLTAQLQALDVLRVLLPDWSGTVEQQKEFLCQLVDVLAEHVLLSKPDVILELAHAENRPAQGDTVKLFCLVFDF